MLEEQQNPPQLNIFPSIQFTKTELDIIADCMANPTVKKYLNSLAYNIGATIAMSVRNSIVDNNGIGHDTKVILHQGQLQLIETLLSIEKAPS